MLLAEYPEVLRRQSLNYLSFGASATCFGVSGSLIKTINTSSRPATFACR